jgi:hypothetical protein
MQQKPFNECLLWRGQLRKYGPHDLQQPPMILPRINSLTGRYVPDRPSIHDEMNYRYSLYSKAYWTGVKERQKLYRTSQSS